MNLTMEYNQRIETKGSDHLPNEKYEILLN